MGLIVGGFENQAELFRFDGHSSSDDNDLIC